MCDEYEQKTRRLKMLGEKLKKIKEDQGEIAVSRKYMYMHNVAITTSQSNVHVYGIWDNSLAPD